MQQSAPTRRTLALLLVIFMLTGLLAGCAGDSPPDKDISNTGGESITLTPLDDSQTLKNLDSKASGTPEKKPYTLMIYVVGSNLESQSGCASTDILEMLDSGLDTSRCNLLIYTGGSKSWSLNVPSDCNTVWLMTGSGADANMSPVGSTGRAVNMGSGSTFADFLTYAYSNYPAEHYGLICWDHGGGPLYGFGNDELFRYDSLSLAEMDAAMAETPFAQEKLDFVGFDACLMASIEIAGVFSDYANYLIASEETEPGSGWDYRFLKVLNDTTDTEKLASEILDTYQESMEESRWNPEYTLSCLDLSRMPDTVKAMDKLYAKMLTGVTGTDYSELAKSRDNTKRFGMGSVSDKGSSLDLVDLSSMAQNLSSDYKAETDALLKQLDKLVVEQVTNLPGACGVSVYYPYDNKDLFSGGGWELYGSLSASEGYLKYVGAFTDMWLYGAVQADYSFTVAEQEEQMLTIQLTDAQLQELSSAYYTIFMYNHDIMGDGTYSPVLKNVRVEPDGSGVIQIPLTPDVYVMRTDLSDEPSLWPVIQMEAGESRTFITSGTCLFPSASIIGGIENIQLQFSDDPEGGLTIQSVYVTDNEALQTYGKSEPDITRWGCIAKNMEYLRPIYDAEHNLLPYNAWEDNGWVAYSLLEYDQEFRLEQMNITELEETFFCQVTLVDTNGNIHGTELVELPKTIRYEETQLSMASGDFTFRVYADHTELVSYSGQAETVTIPDSVKGQPVTRILEYAFYNGDMSTIILPKELTEIRNNAFSGCYSLTQVTLPQTLEVIGSEAFSDTSLRSITIPASVTRIDSQAFSGTDLASVTLPGGLSFLGDGVFADCASLTKISIQGSSSFKSQNGVLFTADGKTLLQYPAGKTGSYQIPFGVETVAPYAFSGAAGLERVIFPEGLKTIDRFAFFENKGLTGLELPDSLEIIGHCAFGCDYWNLGEENPVLDTLHLGPNVSWIGNDAWNALTIGQFTVSEDNPTYSAAGGCLINKGGSALIRVPTGYEGTLELPETVNCITDGALENCDKITALVIPDSVVTIDRAASFPDSLETLILGKGLINWDNLIYLHEVSQISISADNPYFTMVDGSIYNKDQTQLLQYRGSEAVFTIPGTVTEIAAGAFRYDYSGTNLTSITIPASVTVIPTGTFSNLYDLTEIQVSANNPSFASYDGLLYSKDGTQLLACPLGKTGTVEVREGTLELCENAFYNGGELKADTVIIPEGVKIIRAGNFSSSNYDFILKLWLPDSLTEISQEMFEYADEIEVHCSAGSAADTFAREMGMSVVND